MRKIYILGCMLLLQLSGNLNAQVIFSEDFTGTTGTTPPAGWTNNDIEGGGEVWVFNNPGSRTLTAPISNPAAIFDSDFNGSGSGPENAALESPAFDASAVSGYILLSFDHRFYDDNFATGAQYFVEVWDGTAWVEVLTGSADTPDPEHVILNITAAANNNAAAKVRFRWLGEWGWYWILDNVVVEEVSCAPVSDLTVSGITASSIDISWTAGDSETDWNIEYGPAGFTPGSGTLGTASGTSEFTANLLTANTNYDFYVQADCGAGDESIWVGPITGYTGYCEFTGTDSYYFIDNFSTTGGMGANISNLGSDYGTNGYEDATSMIVSSFDGAPDVNFQVDLNDYFGFSIWVDWNNNLLFESGEQVYTSGAYGQSFTGSFGVPAGTAVGSYRMRILTDADTDSPGDACSTVDGYGEAEDYTFEVIPAPSCIPVSDLTFEGATSSSIDISWTVGDSETDWNIEYGPAGFTPGSGTMGTASGTPFFTANLLTADTEYDFYVQADCGAGDESIWIGPISGYTGFCDFDGQGTDPSYFIKNFSTTGGATSNISNLNSGFSTGGYEDATAMVVSQFEGGPDIDFSVDFGDPGNTYGFAIWVDWNGNMIFESGEQVFQSFSYQDEFTGSFGVPVGTAVGTYRMRTLIDYWNDSPTDPCFLDSGLGEAEDYTFEVVPIPTCLPVTDLEIDGETSASIDIIWTASNGETAWNIEWGVPGFTPGTGTGVDSAQASTESFTVPGLDPATTYDIYVQASCSTTDSSYWTLVSGMTLCAPIGNFPWTENFDAMTDLDYNLFPPCWVSENGYWYSDDANNNFSYNSNPYSGNNYIGIYYNDDDYIWTPEFQLTAGRTYEFSFMWAGDNIDGWDGEVFVNDEQSSSGATSLGVFVTEPEVTSSTYKKEFFCFTPTASGVYSFGINAYSNYNPWNLAFDDFSLVERGLTAGTDGALTVCQVEGVVDLNDIVTKDDLDGMWVFDQNPAAIVNDSMFNPEFVPAGVVNVNYVTLGCLEDTATAVITIYPASNAGEDGGVTVCKNEPLNLVDGLTGTVDLGGNWYDAQNNQITASPFMSPNFPGQYNYKYIVSNGVCPNDTSGVLVTVTGCDWLSVDEMALEEVNLYPNPSTGIVYIESNFGTGSFDLTITDINGRVIETGNSSIAAGTNTVNLSEVQRGTYFFKLSNDNAEKVFRVVIQ